MLYTNEAIKRRQKITNFKNIISKILYVILIPLLIYNISLIFQALVTPDKTPSFFGIKTYVVVSGSMEPGINIGDIVIAKSIDEDELKVGDIICFRQGQSVITHRISKIIDSNGKIEYKTKGDNNNAEDSGTITSDLIEGKVLIRIPFLGNITLLFQGKMFLIILFCIVCIGLSHSHFVQRRKI